MQRARDVMTREVATVAPETPVREIARILPERGVSAAPVVDAAGKPVGMVSEGDIIGREDDKGARRRDWWLALVAEGESLHPDYLASFEGPGHRARDVMTSPVVTVPPDTTVPEIARLLAALPGMAVEVETNGTVAPHAALDPLVGQYNVSPKLAHSGNPARLALVAERMAAWAADPRAWFKFVIARAEDVEEVLQLQEACAIPAERIYLMPEGRDSASLRSRAGWLAPLCLRHGFRLSDRLHIHLYGDERGT